MVAAWTVALMAVAVPAHGPGPEVRVPGCSSLTLADTDGDGISDFCELALAHAVAPVLTVRTGGCNWDHAAGRLKGGYLYAVQPVEDRIRVAYLPAYLRDCGWSGPKCLLPWVDCSPHSGDSEFIVVELRPLSEAGRWQISGVFLSAHCFGQSSRSCRWYRDAQLAHFEWAGAAPVVWVAEGRQANYPTWRACNAGHFAIDTCRQHDARFHFPVSAVRNVGSRRLPALDAGCLTGGDLGLGAAEASAVECFWHPDARFRGWQPHGNGVTPYERYLREIAGF
jgi:hypothetical protein